LKGVNIMLISRKNILLSVTCLLIFFAVAFFTLGVEVEESIKVGVAFAVPYPQTAGGFDRVQYDGLQVLKNEFGWEVSIAENVPYPQQSQIIKGYLDKGYDMIIHPDNGQIETWKDLAPKYPEQWMIMMSLADELPDSPMTAAYTPDWYSYGNMLGIIMAKTSETGVIGATGGVPIAVLEIMFSGIVEGAKAVDPDTEVLVNYAGDWNDVRKAKEMTSQLIKGGADVIFTVQGVATKGVYESAETEGAKVIGYCYDAYEDSPNSIMTSLIMDYPSIYKEMANNFKNGTLEHDIYSVGSKYFKVADFRGTITSEVEMEVMSALEKYREGELEVSYNIYENGIPY
jgi:basic membrane protein A and related proteins